MDAQELPEPPGLVPPPGDDLSLVRWTLSLIVPERLAMLQSQADALTKLRDAAEERSASDPSDCRGERA